MIRLILSDGNSVLVEDREVSGQLRPETIKGGEILVSKGAGFSEDIVVRLSERLASIRTMTADLASTFLEMSDSVRPQEVTFTFGIHLGASANLIVAKGSAKSEIQVSAKWTFDPRS